MSLNKFLILFIFLLFALDANALFGLESRKEQKTQIAKARAEFAAGNYKETIKLMQDFTLKEAPKRRIKRAYDLIAQSYIAMQEYDKALLTLNEALEFYPKDQDLHLNLAEVYYLCDLNKRAIEEYEQILKQDKDNAKANLGLARAMLKEGFYSKACDYFKHYVALTNIKEAPVYYDYATSQYLANNLIPSLELALISLEQRPTPDTKLLIAKIYKSQGDIDKAIKTIQEAWLMDTSRKDIYLTYALWLAYDVNQAKIGLKMAREYLQKEPQNRLALFVKFVAYTRLKKNEQAKQVLEQIAALKEESFIDAVANKILENYKS